VAKTRWQLAIFDRDGTLIDTLTVAYGAVREIFRTFRPDIKPPTLENYREVVNGDASRQSISGFYYKHGIPRWITPDQMDEVFVRYSKGRKNNVKPYPGMRRLLILCKSLGMENAIVSASPEDLEKEFAGFGVANLIGHIRSGARDKEEALVEALDLFGVVAEGAFYCNDTFGGLISAKNLGIATIGVTHGFNSKERVSEADPDFLADSLYEVMRIVRKGGKR